MKSFRLEGTGDYFPVDGKGFRFFLFGQIVTNAVKFMLAASGLSHTVRCVRKSAERPLPGLGVWDHRPIRHLGIHTSRVREDEFFRQMVFFDEVDYVKLEKMDKTVDALRKRYGMDSVMVL